MGMPPLPLPLPPPLPPVPHLALCLIWTIPAGTDSYQVSIGHPNRTNIAIETENFNP